MITGTKTSRRGETSEGTTPPSRGGGTASNGRRRLWHDRGSFIHDLERVPLDDLAGLSISARPNNVERALATERPGLDEVAALISPAATGYLERIAMRARAATRKRFGRTIQMFAPLYLSNDCVNTCLYCGFSRQNKIARKTLGPSEVADEADLLVGRGFRHLLLVSAEHPKLVSPDYLCECVELAGRKAHAVQIEAQAHDEATYRRLKKAGCDGVVLYQETYDRESYRKLHVHGMKKEMDSRLDAPDRIGRAGIKHVGLGALLGLTENWRRDVLALLAHAKYMQRRYWRTSVTVSLPRLRPAAGGFVGPVTVDDREFLLAVCALRLALPEAGIVLSTRETPDLRDALIGVGVTQMSAGSSTEPGGYGAAGEAEEQFSIDDDRTPAEVASSISRMGYEPVWKDWQQGL